MENLAKRSVDISVVKRYLPWLVAIALFMEHLNATILNTAVPAIAASFAVTPLSLKAVVSCYVLSLAVGIPVSGWMADRFGTRRVFAAAVGIFTLACILCSLAQNVPTLVAARILQGIGAAMMLPVGRLAIVRTFPKSELLAAMNFVIIPALIGPLLGPTIGGLIVHWLPWQIIFLVNVPVGVIALWLIHRHMPDYRADNPPPLDIIGCVLFGCGIALLSWVLEIFGEHYLNATLTGILVALSFALLAAYGWHARQHLHPLLQLSLFKTRTFRVAVAGGFITRLGLGGMPFLLPLLYQVGLGFPAWQSGLLLMPAAAAAMFMKVISIRLLKQFGYRSVLIINTLLIGITIMLFATVDSETALSWIVAISLAQGLFNSLQYSSMNSMAYADMSSEQASMAATIASSLQQLSVSFGLAFASIIAALYLGDLPQSDRAAVTSALHHAFITLGCLTIISSLPFWSLRKDDGDNISRGVGPADRVT